jgi:D-glycero-alpha-D-manno-heptose-7-phosphate kinase
VILVRAPLRIGFVGGGTDLPDFYTRSAGRVVSATINKYVYVLINPTPLLEKFTVKYQKTEIVDHPKELEHTRIREALLDLGLTKETLEIGTFADLPSRTGLGSSSAFSVALLKALHAHAGRPLSREEAAEAACRLEIELLGEPIGKQDQYAAAYGGFNVFDFRPDHSVGAETLPVSAEAQKKLENSIVMFYTGVTRDASSVLSEQKKNTVNSEEKFKTLQDMAGQVEEFKNLLLKADIKGMGRMLREGWEKKKSLAGGISNGPLNAMHDAGMNAGAFGGKVLGAGGGGCLFFFAPSEKKDNILASLVATSKLQNLDGAKEIPVKFTRSGSEIILHQVREI